MTVEGIETSFCDAEDEAVVDKTVEDEVNEAVSVVAEVPKLVELEVSPEETPPFISILSAEPDLSR